MQLTTKTVPKVNLENLIIAVCEGNLASFPTDTVPALATLPQRAELIFQAKQRSQDKPLILMAGDIDDFWQFTKGTERELTIWKTVADRYLPGALTLVLPASVGSASRNENRVPDGMNLLGTNTIGLRVPDCAIAREILRQTGALATTSANLSGQPALLTMAAINEHFPDVFALDREIPGSGRASTVIQWTDSGWQLLRQGAIEFSDIALD